MFAPDQFYLPNLVMVHFVYCTKYLHKPDKNIDENIITQLKHYNENPNASFSSPYNPQNKQYKTSDS